MGRRDFVFMAVLTLALTGLTAGLRTGNERRSTSAAVTPPTREFHDVAARVDREFRDAWLGRGIQAAAPADDLTVARRLSLGLTGTVPSLEEIRSIESVPPQDRIAWWTNRLLQDRRCSDYVAERLARAYVGTENGPFLIYRRRRFVNWLSDQFHHNRPYDHLVRELIDSTGVWTSAPAVNFVTATVDQDGTKQPDPVRLAARTTRAFLGVRIDCLQCHDDRLGNVELGTREVPREGTQQDFHRLAAFFSEAHVSLGGLRNRPHPYRVQYLGEAAERETDPAPPFLDELHLDRGTRRSQLARWLTHPDNKPFARSTVNRVWALMSGRPLVEPIDDIPLHGPFPPGLETLSDDFVAHDYDLHRLVKIIAATEAFRLDSRAEFEITAEHERAWAVFPLSRLRPDQVAGAVIQACSLKTIDASSHILFQLARFGNQRDFVQRYGDMGEDEFDDRGGTVTQRLLMMNGDLVKEKTQENPLVNAATKIAVLAPDATRAIETAYLAALTRRPTNDEREHFVQRLDPLRGPARIQSLEDLFWTLLNSTEFSWNH